MKILTLENNSYSLNSLPDSVEEPVRFAVLDNSNPVDPDFFFNPLIFLESFNSPAIVLSINNREITMPLDWCIAVGCSDAGSDLEVLPLTSLNDRGFEAFLFNPLTGSLPKFSTIEIINFYNDAQRTVTCCTVRRQTQSAMCIFCKRYKQTKRNYRFW